VKSFASAIKVAPDNFEGYYLLSETLIRLKQFTQAEAVLIAAVKRFPDNGLAYYLLAIAHDGAGNTVPAVIAARKSLDLFSAKGDKEAQQRAMMLLAALVNQAKQMSEDSAVKNAATEAQKAVESRGESVEPAMPASRK
jgi:tetratricopeptide (TPR) repeat protein